MLWERALPGTVRASPARTGDTGWWSGPSLGTGRLVRFSGAHRQGAGVEQSSEPGRRVPGPKLPEISLKIVSPGPNQCPGLRRAWVGWVFLARCLPAAHPPSAWGGRPRPFVPLCSCHRKKAGTLGTCVPLQAQPASHRSPRAVIPAPGPRVRVSAEGHQAERARAACGGPVSRIGGSPSPTSEGFPRGCLPPPPGDAHSPRGARAAVLCSGPWKCLQSSLGVCSCACMCV